MSARALRSLAVLGAAASVGAAAGWATERLWRRAVDPLGQDGLTLPEGDERTVRTDDGAELAVTVAGPKPARGRPTIVLAHGWTNSRLAWAAVARQLVQDGHRVVLYDQRGHGQSTLGEDPPTIERLGDDLAAVLQQLDIRHAVLAGHSMGGFTIMAFACGHPDEVRSRVRGIAFVSTAAHGLVSGHARLDAAVSRLVASTMVNRLVARPRLGLFLVRGAVGRRAVHPHLVATRDMFVATEAAVRAACFVGFREMDQRDGLAKVEVPTVVLVGGRDGLTPPRLARALADALPDAELTVIPDAGHMLPLEEPATVADAIAALAA